MFLLVPAYPGCPGSKAVKRSLLLILSRSSLKVEAIDQRSASWGNVAKGRHRITPVLLQLHWLPAQRRVKGKITCLSHQSIMSAAPTYLSADIQLVSEHCRRHLRSSSYRTLAVPRTRTTLGDRSFAVAYVEQFTGCSKTDHQLQTV